MGEHLIKPYEISVWEDKLIQNGTSYELKETKLAVIGSDKMTGLNRVYDPVFNKKANGEKTLTFSLKYKYFDPYSGNEDIINPFAALLINERKVKLHYGGEWYEFVVKDHSESSDELTWTYTCTDAFVLELSKNGYNITFDSELNNNQGTASELARKTLENTDWQVGGADNFKQYIEEPIYKAVLERTQGIDIINATDNSDSVPSQGATIYLFYSYVKNKDGKNVQFIIRDENKKYTIDSKNVITDTNFRIKTELFFKDNSFEDKDGNLIISLGEIENRYHANRLGYSQLTTYDSVMQRTVDRFKIENDSTEIYRYTDYKYITSDVVTNFITNGENFNALEDGTLQGWNPYTDQSTGKVQPLELVTKPELSSSKDLAKLSELSSIEGFLKVHFNGVRGNGSKIYNTVYNSGFENNLSLIDSISKGDKFVFRWRAATGSIDNLTPTQNLRLIVAEYTQDTPNWGYYYKHINQSDIIFESTTTPKPSYNYITGGTFSQDSKSYIIDGVVQVPSTKYIYKNGNDERIWNGTTYESNNNYHPYYYSIATAQKAVSNAELKDKDKRIGIFIYNTAGEGTYFIQDIQLTRYYEDGEGNPVLIGNAPVATTVSTEYYYVKPPEGTAAEDVETYASLTDLASALQINENRIKPLYNEDSEKYLTISVSQSNCFNILQTIAETFECWVDLVVEHDELGYIVKDENTGLLNKYVYLREYAGKDNWAGFKYGINLQSIERNVNSDEIVTKLIVDQSQSDLVDEGYVSIANAPSNQSGESYILNFDYYYNQGLLNREEVEGDKNEFIKNLANINAEIKEKEKERRDLEAALTTLNSNKNIYNDLVTTAQDTQTKGLDKFYQATGKTYEDYQKEHLEREYEDRLTEDETILSLIGELYTSAAVINNYSGLLSTINKQYQEKYEELHGIEGDEENIGIEQEIENLIEEKTELINNFENKYRKYISEGTWNSTDYIDSELYYLDAVQVSNTSAQPVVSYTINVVDVSQLEGLEYYDFDAGDKSYVEDTDFFGWSNKNGILTPAREEVIVSEVEWHLESPEEDKITVQNYKTRFEDLFQRISAAVQTVQYNEATYAKISSLMDANGTINQDVLVASLNNIAGKQYNLTSNGSIVINDDEILIQNLTNSANRVILNSEGIRISSDGGNTWATAIDGQGINIGAVYTGTLNTNQVIIGSSTNPSFRWDKNGISAYKAYGTEPRYIPCGEDERIVRSGVVYYIYDNDTGSFEQVINPTGNPFEQNYYRLESPYDLQTFVRYDQYGLYGIKNNGAFKASSLDDVKDKAHFAVTWDGFFIKNSYEGGGRVEITSDNDFRVLNDPTNQGNFQEKIKIGALEWGKDGQNNPITNPDAAGATALPTLYGIRIKNDDGDEVMKTDDEGNITISGTIYANAGEIGGMVVNQDKLTMDTIVLEPGDGIYSTVTASNGNRMFSISDVNGGAIFRYIEALGGKLGNLDVIDTLTVGDGTDSGLIKSYNYVPDFSGWMINSAGYSEFSNAKVRGHIEAQTGDFTGWVAVGDRTKNAETNPWIVISGGVTDAAREAHGSKAIIKTSNYQDGAGYGWMIDSDGDAVFNNITARGAIKTAVFEYAEIQAVGGIFIFRPSSTIRNARIEENNLVLKVEKPALFAKLQNQDYSWCKISNYTTDGSEPDVQGILATNGLTHVYKISNVDIATGEVTLLNGAQFINAVIQQDETIVDVLTKLQGGALVDMGREDSSSNYGIGVNSSDNTVNLPRRAISLFETVIDETKNPKVSYKYKGILGTLPELNSTQVRSSIYGSYMAGTQGIYTDNMYIGDNSQYLAFYEDNEGNKHLKISAQDIVFEYDPETETETTWEQHIDEQIPINVKIESSAGNLFVREDIRTTLACRVFKGNEEITNQVTKFTWSKYDKNGIKDETWVRLPGGQQITIGPEDVASKAIFGCEVEF